MQILGNGPPSSGRSPGRSNLPCAFYRNQMNWQKAMKAANTPPNAAANTIVLLQRAVPLDMS